MIVQSSSNLSWVHSEVGIININDCYLKNYFVVICMSFRSTFLFPSQLLLSIHK